MTQEILNSQATAANRQFYFFLTSSTTLGALTGKSFGASDIQVSKNGAAAANSAGTVTEVSSGSMPGLYYYAFTTGELGTDGWVCLTIAPSGALSRTYVIPVVEWDQFDHVHLGITSLPNAAAAASGGLLTLGTGAGQISVDGTTGATVSNVTKISGDTTAPGNVALAFNGTGYVAPTAPAQQQQVANIAVTSAAINTIATANTITTGTETGTFANTATADGVYDQMADVAGTVDFYYEFTVTGTAGGVAVGVSWLGYVVGLVNTIKVYAYNWAGSVWDQIGTVVGISGAVNLDEDWELTSAHTGTGGSAGLVRIRFAATGLTTSNTKTDRILVGIAAVPPTAAAITSAVITQLLDTENPASHATANTYGELFGYPQYTVGSGTNGPTTFSSNASTSTGSGSSSSLSTQWAYFLTGPCTGQSQQVASCDASGNITLVIPTGQTQALTTSPANGNRFQITGK